MSEQLEFYVYEGVVNGVQRYIGKGIGARREKHMKKVRGIARRRAAGETVWATHFYNKLTKAWLNGATISFNILVDGLSEVEAFALEARLISEAPSGQLWNTAPGGYGFSAEQWADPEFRRKMLEREASKKTPEYKAKRSAIARRLWNDQEFRIAWIANRWPNGKQGSQREKERERRRAERELQRLMREKQKIEWDAGAERRRAAQIAALLDFGQPSRFTSERARKVQLDDWSDPDKRSARLDRLNRGVDGRWHGKNKIALSAEELLTQCSKTSKKLWQQTEYREKTVANLRAAKRDPKKHKERSEAAKRAWQTKREKAGG